MCQRAIQVLLHDISPDAILQLTALSATPSISVDYHLAATEDTGLSINMYLIESENGEDLWSGGLAWSYGIPAHEARRQVQNAAVLIWISTGDRQAALEILPQAIQTLLARHNGVAWDNTRSWTSADVRRGDAPDMATWPFPTIKDEYERCAAVAVGKVVAREEPGPTVDDTEGRKYHLNVGEVLHGRLPATIAVFTRDAEFPMVVGKQYLLFLTERGHGDFTVDPRGNSDSLPSSGTTLAEVRELERAQRTNEG